MSEDDQLPPGEAPTRHVVYRSMGKSHPLGIARMEFVVEEVPVEGASGPREPGPPAGTSRRVRTPGRVARSSPPRMALRLFAEVDAERYAREWGAHLWELVAGGEHRQARSDRRRMAIGAPWLALQLRMRALLRRRRHSRP